MRDAHTARARWVGGTAGLLLLGALTWHGLAMLAWGADLTDVSVTGGIPGTCTNVTPGETFYTARFNFHYAGNGQKVILSAHPDGAGDTSVDDRLIIRVEHPDTSVSRFAYDYSRGCQGVISPRAPADLTNKFAVGLNKVTVTLRDKCGGCVGAQPLWMSTQPAPDPDILTEVPDVGEMLRDRAKSAILAAGLEPRFTGSREPDAWVWTQSPRAGAVVESGTTVTCQLKPQPIP